jgi:hypothetical protein
MTDTEFETLVTRLEREALSDPNRYRKRVLLLAFSGYAYITAILLLSLALLVVSIVAVTEATLLAIKFVICICCVFPASRAGDAGEGRAAPGPGNHA